MTTKLDLKKKPYKHLYYPKASEPALVDVPPLQFVMIDGAGNPNTSEAFGEAASALYSVAYTLKFMSKALGTDFTVMPMEGLWWADDFSAFAVDGDRTLWKWTVMVLQPDHITAAMFDQAVEKAAAKQNVSPALDRVRLETYHEGLSAQIMHLGPYAEEGPTVARLHEWLEAQGCTTKGAKHHHEIYLSDPARVVPEKMKTVIRQPVIRVGA